MVVIEDLQYLCAENKKILEVIESLKTRVEYNCEMLSNLLDELKNVYVEFGAVINELGRQPKTARKFFIDYQDRILFGKDIYKMDEYYIYFRVLETSDEYIEYFRKRHGLWRLYGMDLPDNVLKKIYYQNALKMFPSIDKSLFN